VFLVETGESRTPPPPLSEFGERLARIETTLARVLHILEGNGHRPGVVEDVVEALRRGP
jgi:hypothetical protein